MLPSDEGDDHTKETLAMSASNYTSANDFAGTLKWVCESLRPSALNDGDMRAGGDMRAEWDKRCQLCTDSAEVGLATLSTLVN